LKRESRRNDHAIIFRFEDTRADFRQDMTAQETVDLLEAQVAACQPGRERGVSSDSKRLRILSCRHIDRHARPEACVGPPGYYDATIA
jgi:hypothetical protein